MPEAAEPSVTGLQQASPPDPALLSSLGRLVRGLSVLFWGLPLTLVVCVQSAKDDWFRPLGVVPGLIVTGLLLYGLLLLGAFRPQERPWRTALDRARLLALLNLGLSPFLYWWSRIPAHPFFNSAIEVLILAGLSFLLALNPLLVRLTAMLPDETLRLETKLFALINRSILLVVLIPLGLYFLAVRIDPGLPARFLGGLAQFSPFPSRVNILLLSLEQAGPFLVLFIVLLPVAMTMALVWKIKEVILTSVFGPSGH